MSNQPSWLNEAIFYQVYPQSYFDSNADGIGDLPGLTAKLDYIQSLGVNALWINPCFVSPFNDAGYDIADYRAIAPRYGTNDDMIRLLREAHRRDIRVCLDLVPGHTSFEHPWFKDSCSQKRNPYTDRFIWTDSAWEGEDDSMAFISGFAERDGRYATNFFYSQPALNYGYAKSDPGQAWQQGVDAPGPKATRKALRDIIDFWLAQGIDGFRVDMADSLVKHDPGHRETAAIWREIRIWMDQRYPEAVLISEWSNAKESLAAGFHMDFMLSFHPGYQRLVIEPDCFLRASGKGDIMPFLKTFRRDWSIAKRHNGTLGMITGNHDYMRPWSRDRTIADIKVAFCMQLTWPGVPFIYYGDEIGMKYVKGLPSKEGGYQRTGARTPMQWDDSRHAGFSSAPAGQDLYLPLDPRKNKPTVAKQEEDPNSLLNHVRTLLALRSAHPALQAGSEMVPLYAKPSCYPFIYLRKSGDEQFVIAINPSARDETATLPLTAPKNLNLVYGKGCMKKCEGKRIVLATKERSYAIYKRDI